MGALDRCEKYFCTERRPNEINLIIDANKCKLTDEFHQILNQIVVNSDNLLMNVDNIVCEQFNSIINKHLGGKRILLSQRQSYNTRVEAAVISFNI